MSFQIGNGELGDVGIPITLNYFAGLPDPSILGDANLAILFKSLLKKDSITKEKSLAEFVEYLNNPDNHALLKTDELIVLSWLQLYPKLAIANSRTVRIFSHQVQAKFLEILGGKAYSRYLKSSIPIWLFGLFDNDRVVATSTYKTILDSFRNDRSKVEKLWTLFYEQIVNFIITSISLETPDSLSDKRYTKESDSFSKYERVVSGSLSMLIKLIQLEIPQTSVDATKEDSKFVVREIEKLLNSDNIWDYLGSSLSGDTINLGLFKSILSLIQAILANEKPFISYLKDPKGLFKLISKKFIKNVKFNSSKSATPTSNIVYSNVIVHFWDTLTLLTEFSNSDSAKSLKIKKSFWELGGSKSQSRLFDYLRLGPCNSDPSYYTALSKFFRVYSAMGKEEETDEANPDEKIIKTLVKQLNTLTSLDFKVGGIECMIDVFSYFQQPKLAEYVTVSILDILAKTRAPVRPDDVKQLENLYKSVAAFIESFYKEDKKFFYNINEALCHYIEETQPIVIGENKVESSGNAFFEAYFKTLTLCNSSEVILSELAEQIGESLNEGSPENIGLCFTFYSYYISTNPSYQESLNEIYTSIPSFVEKDFVEPPLKLLLAFLKYLSTVSADVNETIEDFFTKLEMVDKAKVPKFILSVSDYVKIDHDSFPEIYSYVVKLSERTDLSASESSLVYKFVSHDDTILQNTIASAGSDHSKSLQFISNISANELMDLGDSPHVKSILDSSWKNISNTEVKQFLSKVSPNIAGPSLVEHVLSSPFESDFKTAASVFHEYNFSFDQLSDRIRVAIGNIYDDSLAISNPLQQNIALLNKSAHDFKLDSKILAVAKFVSELTKINDDYQYILWGAYIAEYISDYLFLGPKSELKNFEDILSVRTDLLNVVAKVFESFTFGDIVALISGTTEAIDTPRRLINHLVNDMKQDETTKFYSARVYKQIVDGTVDGLSLQAFEDTNLNMNQLVSSPLQLSVILMSGSEFVKSSKFDRIRNYVAAEILGVKKESQILSDGIKWVALCINFFVAGTTEVIAPHRLAMVINQISSWLDSDIAYDQEFIPMRVLLARFLTGLISSGCALPDKVWPLTVRLVSDNLSTCQTELDSLELRYFTFRLVLQVHKVSEPADEWTESVQDINEELLDMIVNNEMMVKDSQKDNQAIDMVHSLLQRLFDTIQISSQLVSDKADQLYQALDTCEFIPIQRIAVTALNKHILASQQEFVVEYQLQKSKLNSDDALTSEYQAKLNPQLLANIQTHVDDIEPDSVSKVSRYLWSWYLVFAHFEDTTISIRSEYINQLKSGSSITNLLNYIFEQVDVGDTKLVNSLVGIDSSTSGSGTSTPDITSVSFQAYEASVGCPGEPIEFELRFLLLHLFYLSFCFLGSQVQTWYKEIRDRQLKQRVEKFSSKFVSPILIGKIMNEVTQAKKALESKDENLTIKVNTITKEIKSTYLIDEQTMEMVIKVPAVYPLENVVVNGPLRLGVKENQWKAWLLSSQRVISLTNGSIIEAIELFNKNVNLHFSGFEECAICYSILHQDLSLPSKTCSTCSNKFHAACLYKWFKSSGSSTCPLCRSAFNFKATRS